MEEELKSLLMKVKEKSEKAGLKLNIQKVKIKASDPITSWQIDGGKVEKVIGFIFLDSKITAYNDCSHEIKQYLLLGRKAMTNLDSILKNRAITSLTKVHIVKAVIFPIMMDVRVGPAKPWRIDAFQLCCCRRPTLESPLECKEIKPVNPK